MLKKLSFLLTLCLCICFTTNVYAYSISELYGLEYHGDTEWKDEEVPKNYEDSKKTSNSTTVTGLVSSINLMVDGKNVTFPDQPPLLIEDRTFVPFRFLAEALGAKVDWDETNQVVIIENKGLQNTEIEEAYARYYLKIGEPQMVYVAYDKETGYAISTQIFDIPQAPFVVNNRTMLPFRFVGELLGALVYYDNSTGTAIAETGKKMDTIFPVPILSTLTQNSFQKLLSIFRNLNDSRGIPTSNDELMAAATWRAVLLSEYGYENVNRHTNPDGSYMSTRFFKDHLTNKYPNSNGPFHVYAENMTNSFFQPLTAIQLLEIKGKNSEYSNININDVLEDSELWYYKLRKEWGIKLLPLNDKTNVSLSGQDLSQYKCNKNVTYHNLPYFSFSIIRHWNEAMYESYAHSGLIGWVNSPGHRNLLLLNFVTDYGFGTRYMQDESEFIYYCSDNLAKVQ